MFRLVFQKSDMAPRAITGAVVIGRKPPADVIIADATVSASHAKLTPRDEDSWTIEDLNSTSGTWVNGRRVSQSTIKPGDTITIGKQSIVLEMTGGPTATELMLGVATMYNAPVVEDEPQAALVLQEGRYPERVTTLKKDVTTIGRGSGNTINLNDDTKASASHAVISRAGSKWFVTDAGSINGTKVNGRRIDGETPLTHGAKITVGEHVFQFVVKGAEEAGGTVPASTTELPKPPEMPQAEASPAGLFASHDDWRREEGAPAKKGNPALLIALVVGVLVLLALAAFIYSRYM